MADIITIRTNNTARDVLSWHELTAKEQKEFDYLDTDERRDEAQFARYKGWVYDLGEYMAIDGAIAPHVQRPGWEQWDGYASDSYFSGTLVKFVDHGERVIMATYFS